MGRLGDQVLLLEELQKYWTLSFSLAFWPWNFSSRRLWAFPLLCDIRRNWWLLRDDSRIILSFSFLGVINSAFLPFHLFHSNRFRGFVTLHNFPFYDFTWAFADHNVRDWAFISCYVVWWISGGEVLGPRLWANRHLAPHSHCPLDRSAPRLWKCVCQHVCVPREVRRNPTRHQTVLRFSSPTLLISLLDWEFRSAFCVESSSMTYLFLV